MRHLVLIFVLVTGACVASKVRNTLPLEASPKEYYQNVPDIAIAEDETKIIGDYTDTNGFVTGGIRLRPDNSSKQWKPTIWDGSREISCRNANWTLRDGLLTLYCSKSLFKKSRKTVFDVVVTDDWIFLVPANQRKDFVGKLREYKSSITADQILIHRE